MATTDDDVLALARSRFLFAQESQSENREKQRKDVRFEASSPDDPWQWEDAAIKSRKDSGRPCLTINKLPQHVNQVLNDIRQNRPAIRFRAAGGKASAEVAEMLTGIARHIEAISDADIAYDYAARNEVIQGEGYVRILTQYVSDVSFDQDIFIAPVRDINKVYMDPSAEDPAGADARWCFIEETLSEEEFKHQYPDADAVDWDFNSYGDWFTADKQVRVAEYLSLEHKKAKLLLWANGETSFAGDKLPPGVIAGEQPLKQRDTMRPYVCWRKITGNQVLSKVEYNWKYLPIARVLGNDRIVDGKMVLSGLVRNAKDAQRQYNLSQSAITERVMLAPKTPWLVAYGAKQGFEDQWDTANTIAHDSLTWNHVDDDGNPIPPPSRVAPATIEPGLQQLMLMAADDIKSTTGQYDASLGQKSNETSGRAILARQREGDTATYHYVDNLGRMVRHLGRIILDMLPTVYDTERVARILGEDESEKFAKLDPESPEALQEMQDEQGEITKIFNPHIGVYDVVTTSGPSFTTRRVEAAQAMTEMTQANPTLWGVIGDLLVQNMDWPGAHEMSERLKLTLIPPVQKMLDDEEGQKIPPQAQATIEQLGQQLDEMQQLMTAANEKMRQMQAEAEAKRLEMVAKAAEISIKEYQAETDRLKLTSVAMSPEQVQMLVMQTLQQAMTPQDIAPEYVEEPPVQEQFIESDPVQQEIPEMVPAEPQVQDDMPQS